MGANLSIVWPDTSKNVFSPNDAQANIILAVAWLLSTHVIFMLWTMFKLLDRWQGPHSDKRTDLGSVIGAFILSIPWPVVLLILAMQA